MTFVTRLRRWSGSVAGPRLDDLDEDPDDDFDDYDDEDDEADEELTPEQQAEIQAAADEIVASLKSATAKPVSDDSPADEPEQA